MPDTADIRALTTGMIADHPGRSDINQCVDVAYRMARAYLRRSRNHAVIAHVVVADPDRDLALDLVADLFERDDKGRFVTIKAYFGDSVATATDAELQIMWRRLILGTVSDGLFARYKEADGSLSRVVRNLKRVIADRSDLSVQRKRGRLHVVFKDERTQLPVLPPEYVDGYIRHGIRGTFDLNVVLDHVAYLFASETAYRGAFDLTGLALMIRAARVRLHATGDSYSESGTPDLRRIIRRSVDKVASSRRNFYVGQERLTENEFNNLCMGVEIRFLAHAELGHTHVASNADALRELLPELTDDMYRTTYRNVFEYLYQMTRDTVASLLNEPVAVSARTGHREE